MLYYFRDIVSEQVLQEVCAKAFDKIKNMGAKLLACERHCLV